MDDIDWRPLPRIIVSIVIVAIIFFLFWDAIINVGGRWLSSEEYSHGFIALGVTIVYLIRRRGALMAACGRSSWLAIPLVAIGSALALFSELGATFFLSQYGLIILLAGIVLAISGQAGLRVVIPALVLLFVVIPIPYFLEAQATARLQLLSTRAGVGLLHDFGIAAFADGNVVDLGNFQLDVVEACSGLRYLFPLTGLAVIMAFLYRGTLWQRIIVILSAPPIAIGMNIVRIATIGWLVEHEGIAAARGFVHFFEGWVIFLACAAILLCEVAVMNMVTPPRRQWGDVFGLDDPDPIPPRPIAVPQLRGPLLAAIMVMLAASPAVAALRFRTPVIPARQPLLLFPLKIGAWHGLTQPLGRAELGFLGNPDYFNADFTRPDGSQLNLFIAYYDQQTQGVSPHSPQVCLPGSGWIVTALDTRPIPIAGQIRMVNRAIVEAGAARQIVYYVFLQRGRWMTGEYGVKLALLKDSLLANRTDGALIRFNAPILPGHTEEQTDAELQNFLNIAMKPIMRFIPQ